jgi:hypothetical protein
VADTLKDAIRLRLVARIVFTQMPHHSGRKVLAVRRRVQQAFVLLPAAPLRFGICQSSERCCHLLPIPDPSNQPSRVVTLAKARVQKSRSRMATFAVVVQID